MQFTNFSGKLQIPLLWRVALAPSAEPSAVLYERGFELKFIEPGTDK
jgi:hypothetical protein